MLSLLVDESSISDASVNTRNSSSQVQSDRSILPKVVSVPSGITTSKRSFGSHVQASPIQMEQLAVDLTVGADATITAAATDGHRKAECVSGRGINTYLISALTHLNGIDIGIGAKVCLRGLCEGCRVASFEG